MESKAVLCPTCKTRDMREYYNNPASDDECSDCEETGDYWIVYGQDHKEESQYIEADRYGSFDDAKKKYDELCDEGLFDLVYLDSMVYEDNEWEQENDLCCVVHKDGNMLEIVNGKKN